MGEKHVLSRASAAEYLDISTDTLDRLRAAGKIEAFRAGGRLVRFRRAELDAFMTRQCISSASPQAHAGTSSSAMEADRAASQRAVKIAARLRRSLQHSN